MTKRRDSITLDEVRRRLLDLIARHGRAETELAEPDTSIWGRFPSSGAGTEHPTVTAFVKDVESTFDVYLTEEEWEDPTVQSLTETIHAKRLNPDKSIADWQRERGKSRKGLKWMLWFVNLLFGPIPLFTVPGPWSRKMAIALGLSVFMNTMLLLSYWASMRRSRWKPRAAPSSSNAAIEEDSSTVTPS
jgi:hypothetical protein